MSHVISVPARLLFALTTLPTLAGATQSLSEDSRGCQGGDIRSGSAPGNAGEWVDSARLSGVELEWRTPSWRRASLPTGSPGSIASGESTGEEQDSGGDSGEDGAAEQGVTHMARAFLFRADLNHARAAGWIPAEATDQEALEEVRAALHERLRQAGRFVEARVELEEDGGFAVVFVGRQDPRIEAFLEAGLAEPGRISSRVVARPKDFDEQGVLDEERDRLVAWCEAHPDTELPFFHQVPREEGGPRPDVEWLLPWRGDDRTRAVPILRVPERTIDRKRVERLAAGASEVGNADSEFVLVFQLKDSLAEDLRSYYVEHEGREQAIVLDEWVVQVAPMGEPMRKGETREGTFVVDGAFSNDEVRAIVFAAMGQPLPARLEFTGFGKRELLWVKRR